MGVAGDGAVPEGFGLAAVTDDIAELVDLDLTVGVPFARGGGAVQAQELDQLQTIIADLDRLKAFLAGVELAFPVILVDLAHDPVAEELVHSNAPAAEQVLVNLLGVELCIVRDDHIIQNRLQIAQLDFHGGAVILFDETPDLVLAGNVDVIDNDLLHIAVQLRDGLVDDAVHGDLIQQLGGRIHQIRHIDRHHAEPAVGDRALPEGIQRVLILQARNEGFDLVHGLYRIAEKLNAVLDLQHVKSRTVSFQPVAGGLDGVEADVAVDEMPTQLGSDCRRYATAAEEVRNKHTGIGGCFDDAFKESFGFLCAIVYSFCCSTSDV